MKCVSFLIGNVSHGLMLSTHFPNYWFCFGREAVQSSGTFNVCLVEEGEESQAPKSKPLRVYLGSSFRSHFLIPDLKNSDGIFLPLWAETPLRL